MRSNFYTPVSGYLKTAIQSIWQIDGNIPFRKEKILPKGVVEILFSFCEERHYSAKINEKAFSIPRCFLNGINTASIHLDLPGRLELLGVQLHPLAVRSLFGVPASELSNLVIDLTNFDKSVDSIWHQMAGLDFNERAILVCNWIQARMRKSCARDNMINEFLASHEYNTLTVPDLAKTLCYSPRQLSRKLKEATGMNTEDTLLYKKYLKSVALIHSTDLSLTEVAYESSFFDQAHLNRSFKEFADMTPGEYQRRRSNVRGHVFEDVR